MKLYVTKEPKGTWKIRGERLAGKELAAHKSVRGISRKDLRAEVVKLVDAVARPPKTQSRV